MFHYYHNLSSDDNFCETHKSNAILISGISDYDLGCEWDLFEAPQPILEPPSVNLDHMTSAMTMILCGQDLISQEIKFTDIELLQNADFTCNPFYENKDIFLETEKMSKSLSIDSLISVEGAQVKPNSVKGLENVHDMRRALSEGYIKTPLMSDHTTESRMQKLSRYRDKKTKRNFQRKIKYACRKALADSQPRVKGRFAKAEETEFFNTSRHHQIL